MPIRRPGTTRRSGGARLPADGTVLFTRQMIGTGAPSGTVYVFAQAFARGRVSGTGRVVCRRASSNALVRTQCNVLTTWGDGSAKYTLMAVELSGSVLASNVTENLIFEAGVHPAPGSDLTLTAAALTGRQASVTITPASGTPFTYDLIANLPGTHWKQGPLVAEKRVAVSIPSTAMSGSTAGRIVADMWLLANGDLFVDLCISNDAFNWPDSTAAAATIGASLSIDGVVVWEQATPVLMNMGTGGSIRLRGRTSGGAAADYDPIFLRPNIAEGVNAGLWAPYNQTKGVDSSLLTTVQSLRAGASYNDWTNASFPLRGLTNGGPPGNSPNYYGIPFDQYGAAWMCGGHVDFYKVAMERAEAFRNSSYFMFDRLNNTWVNNVHRAGFRTYQGSYTPNIQSQGWSDDGAHHPMVMGLPAILRGRRSIIDELQGYVHFWSMNSSYQVGGVSPGARLWFAFTDSNAQIRMVGYLLAEYAYALFMTPDNYHGVRNGWVAQSLASNLSFSISEQPRWNALHGDLAGVLDRGSWDWPQWQQAMVVASLAMLSKQGNVLATNVFRWAMAPMLKAWLQSGTNWPLAMDANGMWIATPNSGTPGNTATYSYFNTWSSFIAYNGALVSGYSYSSPNDTNYIGLQRMMLSYCACALPGDPDVVAACTAFDAITWGNMGTYFQSFPKQNFDRPAGFAVPGT